MRKVRFLSKNANLNKNQKTDHYFILLHKSTKVHRDGLFSVKNMAEDGHGGANGTGTYF